MFETLLTVVGTATTAPWRLRSERTGATGTKFRMMSTSRRYDKTQGKWVDGDRLFVDVVCWRDLADHVAASVFKGDPLVVTGRLYTRDYEVDGRRRWAYEIDATSVGHDMAHGTSQFRRPEPQDWPAEVVDPINGDETAGETSDSPAATDGIGGGGGAERSTGDAVVRNDGALTLGDPSRGVGDKRPISPPAAFAA